MVKNQEKLLLNVAKKFEIVLSIIILLIVLLGIVDLSRGIYKAYILDFKNLVDYNQLNSFLAEGLLLVIGVELVIMLSLHMPGALVEVLFYAIARKLILLPKTSGMLDLLLGVAAIGVIFAIRKYLLTSEERNMTLSNIYNKKKNHNIIKEEVNERVV